ncbi:MAG: acylphosphatase [Planctomycetes bacterium]|nr:acylphosphatase [Planctomycetota bacterium]
MIRRQVIYRGTVQGVGFRWTTLRVASQFAVTGYVRNCPDGTVELLAEGAAAEVEAFCDAVRERMAGYIRDARITDARATGEFPGFDVRH